MARLFGTDGIRGVANVDLKPTTAYALGRATAQHLVGAGGSIVVGQDTRRSCDMFVAAITAGATSLGVDVYQVGVVPTPALAFLAGQGQFAAGIMVSASHNPADDNGLKVLDQRGLKLDDDIEDELEALIWRTEELGGVGNAELGRTYLAGRPARPVPAVAAGARPRDPTAMYTIVLDCAHGSGGVTGPEILAATGARVDVISNEPDGDQHQRPVRGHGTGEPGRGGRGPRRGRRLRPRWRRGPAHRGRRRRARSSTATRCSASSPSTGSPAACCPAAAWSSRSSRTAASRAVVEAAGGQVIRTPVGDKYILEGMQVSGARLGGEKSGHVIVLEHTTSGDGVVTALEVLRVMARRGDRPGRAGRGDPAPAPAATSGAGASQGPVGRRSGLPEGDRRSEGAPGIGWPDPRPTFGHGARSQGHGGRSRCGARGGARGRFGCPGRRASKLTRPRACHRGVARRHDLHVRHRRLHRSA